jgi:hypothetical protein
MNLFVMYMAGNSISIFPIMLVGMLFIKPINAIFSVGSGKSDQRIIPSVTVSNLLGLTSFHFFSSEQRSKTSRENIITCKSSSTFWATSAALDWLCTSVNRWVCCRLILVTGSTSLNILFVSSTAGAEWSCENSSFETYRSL